MQLWLTALFLCFKKANIKKPNAPKVYTMAQYKKIVAELAKTNAEAIQAARKNYELAQATGLIYFVGGLNEPKREIWKMGE